MLKIGIIINSKAGFSWINKLSLLICRIRLFTSSLKGINSKYQYYIIHFLIITHPFFFIVFKYKIIVNYVCFINKIYIKIN